MSLDILIVAYGAKKALTQTVGLITYCSAPGYRLTVYENGRNNYPLTWIWNQFVRASRRPYVALCNPDILVGPGWDTEAMACFEEIPTVAAINPLSNYGKHYELLLTDKDPFGGGIDAGGVQGKVEYLKKAFSGKRFIVGQVSNFLWGHCYIFRRKCWIELDGFNEKYEFGGNEYDFSDRLLQKGWRLAICTHSFAYHIGKESTKEAKKNGAWDEEKNQPRFNTPPKGTEFSDI